jgi:hypothetical protein
MIPLKTRFETVRICASVPSNLAKEGRKLAHIHRISFSSYIAMLLEHDLADRERTKLLQLAVQPIQGKQVRRE